MAENKSEITTENGKKSNKKSDPIEGRCMFYLERKRRYCRTVPGKDSKYCVEHSHILGDGAKRKRIPCPLDPKHTCYEDQLKNHLKKCNARESLQPEYYTKNINLGTCDEKDKNLKVTVKTVSIEEVFAMVDRVKELYVKHMPVVSEEILSHDALAEEMSNPMNGSAAQKHLQQLSSLVGHMEKMNLLRDKLCYIEFGAGKGGLSHWVQKGAQTSTSSKYLLVEKGSIRYKMDAYHKFEEQGPNFERLRIDIQHLNLGKVPSLKQEDPLPIVGIGKHLCGGATDLMLRCLMQQANTSTTEGANIGEVEAIVLALCCHHRCDWQTYVGKDFFTELGLNAHDFHLICNMTSWATCATRTFLNKLSERGTGMPDETEKKDKSDLDNGDDEKDAKRLKLEGQNGDAKADVAAQNPRDGITKPTPSDTKSDQAPENDPSEHAIDKDVAEMANKNYQHPRYGNLTPQQREEIGYQCKKLIDLGRVKYLESCGFDVKLVTYTTSELSLENVAFLATKCSVKQ